MEHDRLRALFADGTKEYRNPIEPNIGDRLTLRFRTGRGTARRVMLCICGQTKRRMFLSRTDEWFDYYAIDFRVEGSFSYYFEIEFEDQENSVCCYDRGGVWNIARSEYYFRITPGFSTPDWAKGAVMYQIYVDRFCNGDATNDVLDGEYFYIGAPVQHVDDWYRNPQAMDVRDFYGGDLQGVLKKLDYLQELGIEVIYFNPLFVSPSNHKYDSQDYDYIDPHYAVILRDEGECLKEGETENRLATRFISRVSRRENLDTSNAFFVALVDEIHKRGMRVILDGVFNHCGSFNKWLDRERIYENQPGYPKGAYVAENSPYRNFFSFHEGGQWPYNPGYDGWWGHDTLPKLNYEESQELYEYIMRIAQKWISPPYNVDGWRLDVAADLGHSEEYNHQFWRSFRKRVKEVNPDALILAEHYGSAESWLDGSQWDSVMNYDAFMEPLTWFFTGMEKHSDAFKPELLGNADAFAGAMTYHMARFQTPSLYVAMNELSNHDHSRFLTRTNGKVGRLAMLGSEAASEGIRKSLFMAAVVVQMTWIGAPTVYYGDEAGLCGFTDPDNRRTYPWGREDMELIRLHREAIRIHKSYSVLKLGSLKMLVLAPDILCYGRFDEKDIIIVAVNRRDAEQRITIPVWEVGIASREPLVTLLETGKYGFTPSAKIIDTQDGTLELTLPPESSIILKNFAKPMGIFKSSI